ncbi:MAG: hemolysin family protein [Synergistaceae bacterium]|nr:hemolysin family protein [Synergistaceae bacterium]
MLNGVIVICVLIVVSAFFSMAEISLAASRRTKLRVLLSEGKTNASQILSFQEQSGMFFTTVQIGLNAVAILAGIVGDTFLSPAIAVLFPGFVSSSVAERIAGVASFLLVTLAFVLFADVMPKRVAMAWPETVALRLIDPMKKCIFIFSPLSKSLNSVANAVFKLLRMPERKKDDITSDDLYAMMEAGALAGILRHQEKELIDNVFELDTRTVPSAMTVRENVVYFDLRESEEGIKRKVEDSPHSTYLVCDETIDRVVGYVNSKELLERVLKGQSLELKNGIQIRPPLIIPDTLTLAEAMDQFKGKGEDLAVVLNEYALVVGIISLKDIMAMLMGNLIGQEEQIMKRDDHSWLIEGATPIDDVMSVFKIEEFPNSENYETIGGFLTYMLRRIPHRTDSVTFSGYSFEVMDIDNYKIDQVLVTRITELDRANPTGR